jgi:hypothetical protein
MLVFNRPSRSIYRNEPHSEGLCAPSTRNGLPIGNLSKSMDSSGYMTSRWRSLAAATSWAFLVVKLKGTAATLNTTEQEDPSE